MFRENRYPRSFFDKISKKILTEKDAKKRTAPDTSGKASYSITIPYLKSEFQRFTNNLAKLIKNTSVLNWSFVGVCW